MFEWLENLLGLETQSERKARVAEYLDGVSERMEWADMRRAELSREYMERCPDCGKYRGSVWAIKQPVNCQSLTFHRFFLPVGLQIDWEKE